MALGVEPHATESARLLLPNSEKWREGAHLTGWRAPPAPPTTWPAHLVQHRASVLSVGLLLPIWPPSTFHRPWRRNPSKTLKISHHTANSNQRLYGRRRQLSGFGWPEGQPKVPSGQLCAPLPTMPPSKASTRPHTAQAPPHLLSCRRVGRVHCKGHEIVRQGEQKWLEVGFSTCLRGKAKMGRQDRAARECQ